MTDYWALPSVLCDECDEEYSEPVGILHAGRTGHRVGHMPEFLLTAARQRRETREADQRAVRSTALRTRAAA